MCTRMHIYIYIHVHASMRVRLCVGRMVCAPRCAGFAALDPFRQLLLGNAPWSEAQLAIRFAVSRAARYPARHGIIRGTVFHAARYPARHGIPRGTVSHAA